MRDTLFRLAAVTRGPGARAVRSMLPWALAASATVVLLSSLVLVLQSIVKDAGIRHATTATRTDALHRCGALPRPEERDDCRRAERLTAKGTGY